MLVYPPLTRGFDEDLVHPEGKDGLSQGLEKAAEHATNDIDVSHLVQTRVALALQQSLLHLLDGLTGANGMEVGGWVGVGEGGRGRGERRERRKGRFKKEGRREV